MKDPGAIIARSEEHKAALELAKVMAKKFEMAEPAIFGQIIKFYDAVRAVTHTKRGMINLNITVSDLDWDADSKEFSDKGSK